MQERQTRLLLGKKRVCVCVCVARPLLERYSQIWIISRKAPCDDLTGSPASGSTQSASALGGEGTPEVPCSTSPRSLGTARIQGVFDCVICSRSAPLRHRQPTEGNQVQLQGPKAPSPQLGWWRGPVLSCVELPVEIQGHHQPSQVCLRSCDGGCDGGGSGKWRDGRSGMMISNKVEIND